MAPAHKLEEALMLLDQKLKEKGLYFNIILLGSMALHFNGYSMNRKTDLDVHNKNVDESIIDAINEVSDTMSLEPDWMNNQASTIDLPLGYESRLNDFGNYSNIKLKVLSTQDLISLKVNAIYSRSVPKDIEDLKELSPTEEQLDIGIAYIKELIENHLGPAEVANNKEQLKDFKKELLDKIS